MHSHPCPPAVDARVIQVRRRDHAISRALVRCGMPLSIDEYEILNLKVVRGTARFLWRQSWTRTHCPVYHNDWEALHAVYSTYFHQIITFLPDGQHLHRLTVVNPDAIIPAIQDSPAFKEGIRELLNGQARSQPVEGGK